MTLRTDMMRFLRFGITGGLSTLLHYGVYCLCLAATGPAAAYTVGYAVALCFNYVLTTFFTFRRRPSAGNAVGFVASHVLNYILEIVLLELFLWAGLSEIVAPVVVLVVVVPVNFLLLRLVFVAGGHQMLFVHDRGQMCNNILQFGHLYAWAREHEAKAVSVRFAYKYQYFHICDTRWHSFAVYACAKTAARLRLLPTVDFDAEPQADEAGMDALLRRHRAAWVDGWRVHFHDLFAAHLDEIRALFAFKPQVETAAERVFLAAGDGGARVVRLGLHIRRGDYARFLGGRYFYDDATMLRLAGEFRSLHPGCRLEVYVCGNDPALDEEAYRRALPDAAVVFPKGNPGEDLCVLSHCDYLLGPPSTFSLVAAMYRDVPICWISSADMRLTPDSFSRFDILYRRIEEVFEMTTS